MKIEISNQQNLKRIDSSQLRKYITKTCAILHKPAVKISFLLCDNSLIKDLNKKFFKKSGPTDVIAFPLKDEFDKDYLGEVVVSVEEAVRVSKKNGISWQEELVLYMVHGILHLVGYCDKTKKERQIIENKQQQIVDSLFFKR
ncbi:MAG: rRNA maturation RNase YbeY [Candidatus Omnitrophota bacterium]|nr:MAG: rRNA maturation RNase YbeY [Candidatus Omnitrophota bacterium]